MKQANGGVQASKGALAHTLTNRDGCCCCCPDERAAGLVYSWSNGELPLVGACAKEGTQKLLVGGRQQAEEPTGL